MSRLLMVESWVNANGVILPHKIRALDHSYVLLSRAPELYAEQSPVPGGHPVLQLAEQVVRVDTNHIGELLACAKRLHAERPFAGVITSCDYYLHAAAVIARELGLPGASPPAMVVAGRKDLVREACRRAGLAGPAFRAVSSRQELAAFAREVGYPIVVKPVDLCASEKVTLVHSEKEAVRAYEAVAASESNSRGQRRQRVVLVESLVEGDELCVETLTYRGRTSVLGISGKTLSEPPLFLELGSHTPADINVRQEHAVAEYVCSVLAAIGYAHGVAHVEVRLTARGPVLIEVNPRMGGDFLSELYQHTTGIDIAALNVQLAVGSAMVLPRAPAPRRGSAALGCLLPPRAGRVVRVEGAEDLRSDPRFPRVSIKPVAGKEVPSPADNSSFIGFLVAVDEQGQAARRFAREGLERLRVVMQS